MYMAEIYDGALEDTPLTTQEIRDAYEAISNAFEDYLVAVQKASFCWGYEQGKRDALKGKGGD